MRLAHISDIHFDGSPDQARVVDALCQDLKTINTDRAFDVILVTGDIAAKGDTSPEKVNGIKNAIFSKIKQAAPNSPIVVCPGNHDVNLKSRGKLLTPIFDAIKTPKQANELIEQCVDPETQYVWKHLSGFNEIAKLADPDAYSDNPVFYTKIINYPHGTIGVASLNSAWLTKGGGISDHGHLFFGERQIEIALRRINECSIRIALFHHSLDWLAPTERGFIQRQLAANFHAAFCGHNHENNAASITGNIGSIFLSNTGCIYESREYFNGYSVIDLDEPTASWIVEAREYFYQRNAFDKSPRFAPEGRLKISSNIHRGTENILIPSEVIDAIQQKASSILLSYSASDIAPKQMGALFVEPPLSEISENQFVTQTATSSSSKYTSIKDLKSISEAIHIYGKRESGKTVLLYEIAANRFTDVKEDAKIGFVVDIAELPRFTENSILEAAADFFGGEFKKREIIALLNQGAVVGCLDNVDTKNPDHQSVVSKFCKKFNKVKFIFSSIEEFGLDVLPNHQSGIDLETKRLHIHSFRQAHTRQLVNKWFGHDEARTEQKLETVASLLSKLNIPNTPFLISVLLWVIEQRPKSHLINQASAIEVLIEGLLEKFKESKARTEFDSTIQQHFLEAFAVHLDHQPSEWLSSLDFDEFVVNYFKKKGLSVATRGFSDELLRKGLIYEHANRVAFKFDCFRAYFLAKRFANDGNYWKRSLTISNVGRYIPELDFFTGLNRDRLDVLTAARDLCVGQIAGSGFMIDLANFDSVGRSVPILNPAKIASLEQAMLSNEDDARDKRNFLEGTESPSDVSINHDEGRKRTQFIDSSSHSKFFESLRALSIITRNSELIDDVALKRNCLDVAIEYWGMILTKGLCQIQDIDISTIKTDEFPEYMRGMGPDKIRGFLFMMIPAAIGHIVCDLMATPKLVNFYTESGSEKFKVKKLLLLFLALESGCEDAIGQIRDFMKENRNNTIVMQTVFFKLIYVYLFKPPKGGQYERLRAALGDAFLFMRGGGAQGSAIDKAQFLQGLDRKGLDNKDLK